MKHHLNQNLHIIGNVSSSQVGHTLTNCQNIINGMSENNELKSLLEKIQESVENVIQQKAGDEAELANLKEEWERFLTETTKEKPNNKYWKLSSQGFLDASQAVANLATTVAPLVNGIAMCLGMS